MLRCMKRRSLIAFVWFWGLWSAGSTLEFLGVMSVWPLFLAGIAVAAYVVLPRRAHSGKSAAAADRLHPAR
jgi:hypothetical protein